jgi:hypothetical protein
VPSFVRALAELAEFAAKADAAPREPRDIRISITFKRYEDRCRFLHEIMREMPRPEYLRDPRIRADVIVFNGIEVRIPD